MPVPANSPFFNEEYANHWSYDPDKAKALLAEAGVPDGFTVTMDTRNTTLITSIAQSIQATFAKAGVKWW